MMWTDGETIEGPIVVRPATDTESWAWMPYKEGDTLHSGRGWPAGMKAPRYFWAQVA